jgi:2-methylisocitrate lyase-like PEP mutase family enzyme
MRRPDQQELGTMFAQMHHAETPLVLANPWDAGSARLMEQAGFQALGTTSAGLAFSLGRPDGVGRLERVQVLENLAAIVNATSLPVTADLESGYGHQPEDVAETVALAAAAGAVGCSIEDTTGEPDAPIRPLLEAVERAEAAVAAARALPFPFTVTLRADNHFAGRPDLDDTLRRLEAYEAAGADVLYAPGLTDLEAVKQLLATVSRPVNVLAVPGFSVPALAQLGVRRISLGSGLARAAYAAALGAAREVLTEGTTGYVTGIPAYAELNELLS